MIEVRRYTTNSGKDVIGDWLANLADIRARAKVSVRIARLEAGNFGDCKPVGEGVWEIKTDWGPGYRVYYAMHSKRVILLCEGGDKRKQNADIKRAIKRWNEWQKRGKK